jgi:hypothetical protein
MSRWLRRNPIVVLGLGIVIGLLVGGLRLYDWQSATKQTRFEGPAFPLHAAGGHGSDGFAMAVGSVDENFDGLYTLDFTTGDLKCWLVSPHNGKFVGVFAANVLSDIGVEKGKKPNYSLVAGRVGWKGGKVGPLSPSGAVVYVADANSGNFAAYGLSYSRELAAGGLPQKGALTFIDAGKGRTLLIRE